MACLNNQHECARLLRALHWAHRKDSTQNEKMQEEQVQQRREEEQKALQNRLKAEKADIAYSDWLEKKEFGSARTVPQECEIRKRVRTTPSTKSSSCTTCTPSSKHQSAHHGQKTIVPTKVSLHQEERNLKSVGKPDKMHPYTNHPLKPKKKVQRTRKNNRKCKSAASLSESRSGHNFKAANQSSVSMPSEITLYNTNEERELTGAHGHKEGNRATVENKMTVHLNSSNPKEAFEPSLDNSTEVSSEDSGSESEESGSDNQFNNMNFVKMIQNDTNEDDDDDYLPFPQFGFDMEDDISESLFHDVGESNDLNSLSLPPILTKGRTPAEVLQLLRHLGNPENSKRRYRRSNSISYSSRVYSGHYKRRLSLGSIPEGKIVTDYTEQEDDDNLDSQILKNLANAIDCISGTEKGDEENDPHIQWHDEDESGEQNSAAAEESVVNEEENEPSEKLESSSSSFLKVNDTQSSNCDLPQNNKATPPPQTLKVINFFWDPASNSVQTHIAATPLISPRKVSHRSPSPTSPSPLSLNVTSPSGLPPMVNTPSRKVTPPTSVDTPLSYTATPPPRKVTPPPHKVAPPSYMQTPPSSSPSPHKITPPPHKVVPPSYMQTPPSSSIVTPSPRKVTPPPSYVETPSTSTPSPSYADTASFSSAMINSLLRKITPPSRKNTPPSRKNTPPSRKNTPPSCRSTPPSHGVLFPLTESIQSTHDEVTASYHPSSSSPIHQSNSDPCFYPRDTLASQNPLQSSSSSPNSLIPNHETKIFFIGDAEETVEPELEVTKQVTNKILIELANHYINYYVSVSGVSQDDATTFSVLIQNESFSFKIHGVK